jgi:sterol 3beta-glucosyltransferase
MRILINTFGTRGDIQPYIALGKGLKAAGHRVAVGTSEGYRALVEEHQLQFAFIDRDLLLLSQAVLGESGVRETFGTIRKIFPAVRAMMDQEWQAALDFQPDLIIYHSKCLGSLHVAEKLNIPAIMSLPLPFYTPTREFPVPFMANVRLGGWFNRFSYPLMGLSASMYSGHVNDLRVKTLGLPKIGGFANMLERSDGSPVPVLYPYSTHLLPRPADFPAHVHVTGYWFLDRSPDWQPQPELVQFLEAGPAPVYIGFGSMGGRGGRQRAQIALEALQKSGQRGVLARGWGGLNASDLPANVLMLETVPHDWLFPQVAAVVHHGGAGTTAAGLRAGKPSIICPFVADQPFWGGLVYQRGVGPKPISQSRLNVEALAESILLAVHDQPMKQRAAELGAKIRAEDGVARAVEIIGSIIPVPASSGA